MVQLDADGAEDGAHRTRGATLLADDLAHVLGRDTEPENGVFVAVHGFDVDGCRLIHQGPRNFADQFGN